MSKFNVERIGNYRGVLFFICYLDYGAPEEQKAMFPMLPTGHYTAYINVDKPKVELNDFGETVDGEPYFELDVPFGINFYSKNGHSQIEGTQYMGLIGWDYAHMDMDNITENEVFDDVKTAIDQYLDKYKEV